MKTKRILLKARENPEGIRFNDLVKLVGILVLKRVEGKEAIMYFHIQTFKRLLICRRENMEKPNLTKLGKY